MIKLGENMKLEKLRNFKRVTDKKLNKILLEISPILYKKKVYRQTFRKRIDLKNPKEFNEKLIWLNFNQYYKDPLVIQCADKYKVREYVEKCGCKEILNELIGVYENSEEIKWDDLPEKFVLKCNHGTGYNIICNDKGKLDKENVKIQLNKWLKEDFSKVAAEMQYKRIPRKIICEKYIDMGNDKLPIDYKIYCFNGEPRIILVMKDRDTSVTREFYDMKWQRLHLREFEGSPESPTKKPDNLNEMIEYAKKLSKPFKFVRADFYNINDKIIFGELTFTPAACMAQYTEEISKMLGDWIDLNN